LSGVAVESLTDLSTSHHHVVHNPRETTQARACNTTLIRFSFLVRCAPQRWVCECALDGGRARTRTPHTTSPTTSPTHTHHKTHTHSFVFVFVSEEGGVISATTNMPTRMQKVRSVTRARGHPPWSDVNKPTGAQREDVGSSSTAARNTTCAKNDRLTQKIHSNGANFPDQNLASNTGQAETFGMQHGVRGFGCVVSVPCPVV
jgi:hypothetical protein